MMNNRMLHILVDEMNLMFHLHKINVQGFRHWKCFYESIENLMGSLSEAHFFCANVPEHDSRYIKREAFFNALIDSGIHVQQGRTILKAAGNVYVEKGVDVLLSLQILKSAQLGVEDIVVCSADSDYVPAILQAQALGSRVHVVVSNYSLAKDIVAVADSVIALETLLQDMNAKKQLNFKLRDKPYVMQFKKNFENLRRGGMLHGIR